MYASTSTTNAKSILQRDLKSLLCVGQGGSKFVGQAVIVGPTFFDQDRVKVISAGSIGDGRIRLEIRFTEDLADFRGSKVDSEIDSGVGTELLSPLASGLASRVISGRGSGLGVGVFSVVSCGRVTLDTGVER